MSPSRGRWRARASFVGAVVAVAAVAWVLHGAGHGPLAPPPLRDPASWGRWAAERDPVVAALAVLRLVALGALWYLLVATVLGGVLRACRAEPLVAIADRLTIPAVRRLLVATTSVTLMAGVSPAVAFAQAGAPTSTVTSTTTTTTTVVAGGRPPPTLTMRVLPDGASSAPVGVPTSGPVAAPDRPVAAAPVAAPVDGTWTVRPGECFWSIADSVLTRAWGRAPTDPEIVPYWRTLIEANRSLLKDRSNPDLIFPAQTFTVPPPPSAPAGR